jgi:hypothetical protein
MADSATSGKDVERPLKVGLIKKVNEPRLFDRRYSEGEDGDGSDYRWSQTSGSKYLTGEVKPSHFLNTADFRGMDAT